MKDFDPSVPNLEFSQDELGSLHAGLAEALVRHGRVEDNLGVYGPQEGVGAYIFTCPLPKELVHEVFYAADESLIIRNGSFISYVTPHRVEQDDATVFDSILLSLKTKLADTNVKCAQTIFLRHSNGNFEATFDTEYSNEEGMRISPNDIPRTTDLNDNEAVHRLLDDIFALERPLVLDDAERLRRIIDFIATS